MARMTTRPTAGYSTGTVTLTIEEQLPSAAPSNPSFSHPPQNVVLRLRVPKKKVTWREGTVDNEFLNRKSSKKCCIFHKQKSFDEDDSEEEDDNCGGGRRKGDDYDGAGTSGCCHHDGLERRSN